MAFTIQDIAQFVQGTIQGLTDCIITKPCTLQHGEAGGISFLAHPQYTPYLYTTQASAVLIKKGFQPTRSVQATLLWVEDPYASFAKLLTQFQHLLFCPKQGVEIPSYLGQHTTLGKNTYRGAFSYIGDYVQLGDQVQVYPHVYIGDHVVIGAHTILYSGAVIYPYCRIGQHCIIQAGAVIGSDGFGFAPQPDGSYQKIPQLGNVVLEDQVEVGANTVIDRATLDTTLIQQGTKLDNLIQVAHNVTIGQHTVLAAQTGIAGSATIGPYCRIGGQVGIAGHSTVGPNTTVMGQTGVTKSCAQGNTTLLGTPAFDRKQYLRCYAVFKKLPDLEKRIEHLKKEIINLSTLLQQEQGQ